MAIPHISQTFSLEKWLSVMAFAGLAMMLFFGALFSQHPTAKAASATCYDITGQGTEVLKGGVPNSGVIDFETLVPAYALEGCAEDNNVPLGDGPFELKGWAWDTNLGWISLYCGDENADGAPYENLGEPCGNVQYGVTMEGNAGANPGRLSGFAWGDNTGFISFNCANTGSCGVSNYYVEVETSQGACLGDIFSGSPPAGCVARPNESTFAWSDNVGWIDMAGVTLPWFDLIGLGVDVELEILSNDGVTDLLSVNKLTAPVADGAERYFVVLRMTRSTDGSPVSNPGDYAVTLSAGWNDSVDFDQTDLVTPDYSANNNGPVQKFFDFSGFDPTYGAIVPAAYVAEVTSLAPTSSMNGYDEGGDGTVDSSHEDFVLGAPIDPVPQNIVGLRNVFVSVEHLPTTICAFGGPGCAAQDISGVYGGQPLDFKPAIDVAEFSDSINGATISARHLVANSIDVAIDCLGAMSGCGGTIDTYLSVDSPFEFVFDSDGDGADCEDVSTQFNLYDAVTLFGSPLQLTPVFEDGPDGCLEGISQSEGENAYVYTEVEYQNGGQTINYFSSKLPRVQGTLVVNPVADISGNVYSTGVTNPQTNQEVRSLGDVSTNVLRDTISRNVENIVAGIEQPVGSAPTVNFWNTNETEGFEISGAYASLLPDLFTGKPKVFYFTQDLHISNIDWEGERTFIVKGADVYIDGDIYSNTPSAKLGIIVLEDLATEVGGNVYIDPSVKNIQANIFADGSVFSWYPANGINADGEPIWADEADRFNRLRNQLYIQGSIASQNTIGGAVRPEPILGDGTVASASEGQYGATPSGRSQARLYDLNFLRYYGLVFQRDGNGNAVDQQGDSPGDPGYLQLDYVGDGGDLILITDGDPAQGLSETEDFSAVYVEFDPPSLGLPGFSVSGGVDIRLLP